MDVTIGAPDWESLWGRFMLMSRGLTGGVGHLRSPWALARQMKSRRADQAAIHEVFDRAFYVAANPDVVAAGVDPWRHYTRVGAAELRSPSPLFDPRWYFSRYPDVRRSGIDPLAHFLRYGAAEGRDPHPLFSTSWYQAAYPEVKREGINPLLDFLRFGAAELRDPHPLFDTRWYLSQYPEVRGSGVNPLVDYLQGGAAQGRNPNPYFYGEWYLTQYPDAVASGLNPLIHYVETGEREGYQTNPGGTVPRRPIDVALGAARLKAAGRDDVHSVQFLLDSRWRDLEPLKVYRATGRGRVNVVTDSVGADSLFGGVATALILATLWAAEQGRGLRIITRASPPDATGYARLQALHGLELPGNPEFVLHGPGATDALDVRADDVFLTTSWWSTAATLPSIPPERICYLLQEDERMFYAAGDEALRAGAIMSDPRLLVLVNSEGLFDHLVATGCPNLAERGMAFEASFELFSRRPRRPNPPSARQLFFYSRPNNPRNLFYLGLEVIEEALRSGILDPRAWTINMVGAGTQEIEFSGTPRVVYHPALDWEKLRGSDRWDGPRPVAHVDPAHQLPALGPRGGGGRRGHQQLARQDGPLRVRLLHPVGRTHQGGPGGCLGARNRTRGPGRSRQRRPRP